MSYLFLTLVFLAASSAVPVMAIDGAVRSQKQDFNRSVYQSYEDRLETLKADLSTRAAEIGAIMDCHKSGRLYTSSGCRNVYLPNESDPSKAPHADKAINGSTCSGHNEVRHFTGSTWSCKGIRRVM